MQLTLRILGDDFTATLEATGQWDDYGVPGSPRWVSAEDPRITSVEFLGRDVPPAQLPEAMEAAILELANDLEWEPAE